ncbi:acetyltransferase [unidentified eubacterium SCB49]|nr:acetyltransferase [unidentified eubacterium SCB49]
MIHLQGTHIYLRALEVEDLDLLFSIENDTAGWELSNTQAPYSKHILTQYLNNAHQDIYEAKQLRLVVATSDNDKAIGFIDLFDFDPKNRRVGVGILLLEEARGKGYGKEALRVLCDYAFKAFNVHQLYANITTDNVASITLFENQGFIKVGIKKDWIISEGNYKDELLYQYIKE